MMPPTHGLKPQTKTMPELRVVTLDLDNTLWDVDRTIIRAESRMKEWLREHAPDVFDAYQPELLEQIRGGIMRDPEAKRHDLTYLRIRVLTELARHAGYASSQAEQVAQQAFAEFFIGRNQVEFFPGALEMLQKVSAHYPVYALTNGNADVERTGISRYLKGAYSSADVGASKPDAEMFTRPLAAIGLAPEQAVHVGDHLIDDVQGANDAGLASIWVNLKAHNLTEMDPQPHAQVSDLLAVFEAIQSLAQGEL